MSIRPEVSENLSDRKEKEMEETVISKNAELIEAMRNGIIESLEIIKVMGEELINCSSLLRVEQSERVFISLSDGLENLGNTVEFIKEIKRGVGYLRGCDISAEPLSCWDKSLSLFKEMLSAFENKDWITVADLIQYETYPLLEEGRKGLTELLQQLNAIEH